MWIHGVQRDAEQIPAKRSEKLRGEIPGEQQKAAKRRLPMPPMISPMYQIVRGVVTIVVEMPTG